MHRKEFALVFTTGDPRTVRQATFGELTLTVIVAKLGTYMLYPMVYLQSEVRGMISPALQNTVTALLTIDGFMTVPGTLVDPVKLNLSIRIGVCAVEVPALNTAAVVVVSLYEICSPAFAAGNPV